ncbi:outer membrane beta-barrel protein [Roseovarius sp. CAU 1744]|uniref:outer membrane protein n=1 Tax=Roseovarius sp. CAU 1744 TaxID=3140368 RepID=UPI00325ACE9F
MSAQAMKWVLVILLLMASPVLAEGWRGPYVGLHLGGAVADFSGPSGLAPGASGEGRGMVGGLQVGYNWQRGNSVLGAEADLSFADISDDFPGGHFEEDMMTSLRFRAGVATGDTLVFGTLGVAWTEQQTTLTGVGSSTDFEPGLMMGAGAERFLGENVTGRVEAYFVDAPADTRVIGATPTANGSQNVVFRAGLSLHF